MAGNLLTVRKEASALDLPFSRYGQTRHEIRSEGFLTCSQQVSVHYVATATPLQQIGSISVDAVSQDSQRYHAAKHAS